MAPTVARWRAINEPQVFGLDGIRADIESDEIVWSDA